MKSLVLKSILLSFLLVPGIVQGACFTLVGKPAPEFKAKAVFNGEIKEISLSDYAGKNKILIFYPADFSFICPTELFAFQEKLKDFEERNTVLIAISVDQIYSHQRWLEEPRNEGGIQGITYPVASDITKKISTEYQVLDENEGVALRGLVIIDKNNIVQARSIYNLSIGREINEVLRILDAILFTQEHGQVCPANWAKGQKGMTATEDGLKEYLKEKEEKQ
jgi:peroxiredoxin (alkyl hydroperoxide reductase subunit C)